MKRERDSKETLHEFDYEMKIGYCILQHHFDLIFVSDIMSCAKIGPTRGNGNYF
jgi:hypothetical protein